MILSSSSGGADAADAKLGAFIGCANLTKPEWIRRTADYANFRQFTPQTIQGCRSHCADQGYPLALVSRDWRCRCTLNLPDYYYMWPDYVPNKEECIPMPSKPNVETAAAYYVHANANTSGCRLSYPEFYSSSRSQWSIDYKSANIEFRNNTRGGSLYIRQLDTASGARLRSRDGDHLYGMWQVRSLPTARTNSVTAFRIRSNNIYPRSSAGSFSEIDIKVLNQAPAKVPSSLRFSASTNSRLSYQKVLAPATYQRLMGWSGNRTVTNTWTTLSINWQPTFVSWALDGRVVRTIRNGDMTSLGTFQSPTIAARVFFSIGTEGGGRFDAAGGPAVSAFNNFRRIICDLPEPKTLAELGPPWLTAVLYPAPVASSTGSA